MLYKHYYHYQLDHSVSADVVLAYSSRSKPLDLHSRICIHMCFVKFGAVLALSSGGANPSARATESLLAVYVTKEDLPHTLVGWLGGTFIIRVSAYTYNIPGYIRT